MSSLMGELKRLEELYVDKLQLNQFHVAQFQCMQQLIHVKGLKERQHRALALLLARFLAVKSNSSTHTLLGSREM